MYINIERDYREHYDQLFQNENYAAIPQVQRGYALPRTLEKDAILFIGINPSFSENRGAQSGSFFYGNDTEHPYFNKFNILASKVDHAWSHLDLLAIRETNQKSVEKLINTETGGDFIWQQLLISKELMEQASPRVIVVSNTLARRLMGKESTGESENWMGYKFEFDSILGTDKIVSKDSQLLGTPVFFTSMLSGQRALDNGSFERLCWHITKVIAQTG